MFCSDKTTGLKAIIAIHSTKLGPAVGGCRMWDYVADERCVSGCITSVAWHDL
ncbi:MAG: Glu/Leu/Phe/Val dehydrogenase dimerization domain-containing protein [Rheinheimera sp.]|nr:Glu/Leu/Phe/Val dehydrogenase dimerization domain-containing protein [Rheinheimera sp.]